MCVKRLVRRGGRTFLHPANDRYQPVEMVKGVDWEAWGKVTFVIRPPLGPKQQEATDETPAETPDEATFDESQAGEVVDLLCWIQANPRPIKNLLFAEKRRVAELTK